MSEKSVANKSAMQVQNMKQTLNEWKYVVALLDQGLNTTDPIKSATARAGLYTTVYVVLLVTNVSTYLFAIYKSVLAKCPDSHLGPPSRGRHSRYFHWKNQRQGRLKHLFKSNRK